MQTIYQKMETTELDAAIEALKAEVAEVMNYESPRMPA